MGLAVADSPLVWRPHPGQQERFLSSPAFEALFGGAAGPGKTECLLMEALRQVAHPKYTGIIFRRTFPMLEGANGLIQRSLLWYPSYGGTYNASKHYWTFPSGARIYFGHMQHDSDKLNYQGAEFSFCGFDELTEFDEPMYLYMFTRVRASKDSGLRSYIRAASNPGNVGHNWVKRRFITKDIVNRPRYFAGILDQDGKLQDTEVSRDHPNALTRAYYPAKLSDNPSADPNYLQRIRATGDPVLIAQLELGDWDAMHTEGLIYANWSTLENVTNEAEYNPDLLIYWGCDDGYVYGDGVGSMNYHPRVVLLLQDNAIGGLSVFDEYVATGETHDTTIQSVLSYNYARPSVCYVDSSAALFRGELNRFGLQTVAATHRVGEGIKSVRGLVQDGAGNRLLRIHPRCQHTIREFSVYRSDPKGRAESGEIIPLKLNDHSMDCIRYVAYHRRQYRGRS